MKFDKIPHSIQAPTAVIIKRRVKLSCTCTILIVKVLAATGPPALHCVVVKNLQHPILNITKQRIVENKKHLLPDLLLKSTRLRSLINNMIT